jgi:hypothetical protein
VQQNIWNDISVGDITAATAIMEWMGGGKEQLGRELELEQNTGVRVVDTPFPSNTTKCR